MLLSDLPPAVVERVGALEAPTSDPRSPQELLRAVLEAGQPFTVAGAGLHVVTDSRWYMTLPSGEAGAPLLELRRWPGDAVLALYALAAPSGPGGPPVAEGGFAGAERDAGGVALWSGRVETPSGPRQARWLERAVAPDAPYLGALLLPGDGGLGEAGMAARGVELRAVFDRLEVQLPLWRLQQGLAPGATIEIPSTSVGPGVRAETDSPWQVARASSFTIGLPPGLLTQRLDAGIPSAVDIPGGRLWIRGRFVDLAGTTVVVGDAYHAGYVAEIASPPPTWIAGKAPPLVAPQARRLAAESYGLAVDRTGAEAASAERWRSADFSGEWLLFRLALADRGIEIGLPLVEGRRSQSLFWIPVSWRDAGRPPAPPPVDPAARFGIRFERLTRVDRQRSPWTEGYLEVPGMHVEIPLGWFPAASLRTSDGFPVRVLDEQGAVVATLARLEPGEWDAIVEPSGGWSSEKRRGGAAAIHAHVDGSYIFAAREGHAFRWTWSGEGTTARELWSRLIQSVRLLHVKGKRRDP